MIQQPRPGDFGLIKNNTWVGFLIRIGQVINGDWNAMANHAFIVGEGDVIYEAQARGFVKSTLSKYDDKDVAFSGFNLTGDRRAAVLVEAEKLLGTKYSWVTYVYLLLYRLGINLPWLKARIASNKDLICSASVDLVYYNAGIELFDDHRLPGDVTPADLSQLLLLRRWRAGYYNGDINE